MLEYRTVREATPELRRRAERHAVLSASTAAIGDIMLTDSAIIILYAVMLGASDMYAMMTTSLQTLLNGLFVIPMAYFAEKIGNQRLILRMAFLGFLAYLAVVAAPWCGRAAVPVLILATVGFALFYTGYIAGWFPMLDSFLTPQRRSGFLGSMRFCWQLTSACFILLAGLLIGSKPPIHYLQIVLFIGALSLLGRIYYISRIPVFISAKTPKFDFRSGLAAALANKPLAGYAVYLFVLNLAAYGTIPLAMIYLKRHLGAPDNLVAVISAVTLTGMLAGSLCAGKIITRFGIRRSLLFIHLTYAVTNLAIFFIGKELNPTLAYVLLSLLLFVYSFTFANANIASTSEMMALATPGNKVMALAFCGSFYYGGSGLSRLLSSLILGSGILAPYWSMGGVSFSHYQSLFLVYAVAVIFAAMLLVVVPAIFPKGEYVYTVH